MDSKNRFSYSEHDFLHNEDFIRWRLLQTKELDEYWENFVKENPHLEKVFREAVSRFTAMQLNHYPLSETDKKDIYRTVLDNISRREKRRKLSRVYSVAAVFLAGALMLLYFALFKEGDRLPFMENADTIIGQTLPEEEIYLISAGEKINLSNHSRIDLIGEGKALVTDSAEKKELLLTETSLNKLVVPYGKRSNLTLSDGTEIWLNSGTQLDFPSRFNGETRDIYLDGEIFIHVAKNREVPFIVHMQGADIHVQGTSFNISAYRDEVKKTVVLVDGKVMVKTDDNRMVEMIPNEKIDITDREISKEIVNVSEYISWKSGVLEFNRTPMSEILKKVGRYYNVQFEETPEVELNAHTFSGKLFLSSNLDSVMTSVSILSSTTYLRNDNLIKISKK